MDGFILTPIIAEKRGPVVAQEHCDPSDDTDIFLQPGFWEP